MQKYASLDLEHSARPEEQPLVNDKSYTSSKKAPPEKAIGQDAINLNSAYEKNPLIKETLDNAVEKMQTISTVPQATEKSVDKSTISKSETNVSNEIKLPGTAVKTRPKVKQTVSVFISLCIYKLTNV